MLGDSRSKAFFEAQENGKFLREFQYAAGKLSGL